MRASSQTASLAPQMAHSLSRLTVWLIALLVILYDVLMFAFYFLWQQPWRRWPAFNRPRSISDPVASAYDHSVVRRSVKHLPEHFLQQCKTLDAALDRALKFNGSDATSIGYREVLSTESAL